MSYASNNTVSVSGLNLAARILMILLTRDMAARVSSSMSYVERALCSVSGGSKLGGREAKTHVVAI